MKPNMVRARSRLNTALSHDRFSARNFLEADEWMSRRNAKFSGKDSVRQTWFRDKGAVVIQIEMLIHPHRGIQGT